MPSKSKTSRTRFKLVTSEDMQLRRYPCGVSAGDQLRLRHELVIRDLSGQPTGELHHAGEVCDVLTGNSGEPDVIWLRWLDGDRHTWSGQDLFETFEIVK